MAIENVDASLEMIFLSRRAHGQATRPTTYDACPPLVRQLTPAHRQNTLKKQSCLLILYLSLAQPGSSSTGHT